MRRALFVLICLLSVGTSSAQQLSQYTYFTYNYMNYNPAVTGTTPCLEMKLGYRRQWWGFDGEPRTGFASVHGKFGANRRNFHGLGAFVEGDEAGPFSYTSMFVNYAYHMEVGRADMLSMGLGVGFSQYKIDIGGLNLEQPDIDPVISGSISDFIFPQFNAGLWLYNSQRFIGVSMRRVNQNDVENLTNPTLRRHFTLAYGRAFDISDELIFKPAALLNYVGKSRASLEAQALLEFKKKVQAGLAVRSGNGISALIRLDVIPYITIAYAYDLTVSRIRLQASSSHEIMLGVRACASKPRYHVPCAAYD